MEHPVNYFLLAVLNDGRQEVLGALEGLTDAQAAAKPGPGRWSVLECMEHISLVEDRFLGWITHGKPQEPSRDDQKEKNLLFMMMNRSEKREAPEAAQPTGKYATVAEAIAEFQAARDRSVHIAKTRGGELYSVQVKHPRFGEMNGVELMHILAGHARRHTAQILETREALGYS